MRISIRLLASTVRTSPGHVPQSTASKLLTQTSPIITMSLRTLPMTKATMRILAPMRISSPIVTEWAMSPSTPISQQSQPPCKHSSTSGRSASSSATCFPPPGHGVQILLGMPTVRPRTGSMGAGSTCSFARVNRTVTLASPFQPRPLVVLPQEFHPQPRPLFSAAEEANRTQDLRSGAGPAVRPALIPSFDGLPNPSFPSYPSLSTNVAPRLPFSTASSLFPRVNKNDADLGSPDRRPQALSFSTSTNRGYGYSAPVDNGMPGPFAAIASHHPNPGDHRYCHPTPAQQEWFKTQQDERDQVMGDIMMNAANMAELAAQQCRLLFKFQTLDKARRR
ncbi:hypothetical protein GE09DRAFT_1195597 [Coniochaeta sp. 2T2.1]|nr:hypothetical protein GE09DRAFT_1195597 [Coniochaeta sp. 2T2.1]